ncbi:DUF6119 family protein [Listeria costaricensis]|uniref:DUF6119 family protein n=1 Tax=Listeria costaricensis TaxID=2026604 RepID=UPI000C07EF0C|nr:DUF6119 family protein [Listeria costaricensis]
MLFLLAKVSKINSFAVDTQQDILQGITISLNQEVFEKEKFGKTIDGRDALTITVINDITNIDELLELLYKYYIEQKYKSNGYEWIDYIEQVRDPGKMEELDSILLEQMKSSSIDLNLAPPELIDWDDFEGFSSEIDDNFDEIVLDKFLPLGKLEESDTIQIIKDIVVDLIGSEEQTIKKSWKLYNCINSEVKEGQQKYILTNGNWYKVEDSYLQMLEKWWKDLNIQKSSLPKYEKIHGKHNEGRYNEKQQENYEILDKKLVRLPQQDAIEVCDLYKDGRFIHIKIYKSSSDISHLMAQALVSSDLFIGNEDFREKFNEKLSNKLDEAEIKRPTREKYEIILGIITNKDNFDLPFFTKVNLRTNMKHIEMTGLKCYIEKIEGSY